jgi:hypothetical protein
MTLEGMRILECDGKSAFRAEYLIISGVPCPSACRYSLLISAAGTWRKADTSICGQN